MNAGQGLDAVLETTFGAVAVLQQRIRLQAPEGQPAGSGNLQGSGEELQYDAAKQFLDRAIPLIHELNELTKNRTGRGF